MKFQMDGGIAYDFEEDKEDQEDIDYKQLAGTFVTLPWRPRLSSAADACCLSPFPPI